MRVVVVGGGYVGLPLAAAMSRAGMQPTVYDTDPQKVEAIRTSRSYIPDVLDAEIEGVSATDKPDAVRSADVVVVCVPTPLSKTREPDTSAVLQTADYIGPHLQDGCLVVLESTTFPGFTREIFAPRMPNAHVAFSPERVDPGNREFGIVNTPKVVGGVTKAARDRAVSFYRLFIDKVVPVSNADTAETVKLLENTFRAVNIALANEVAIMCGHLGVDTREVIQAAATKPFGFMPFYPGPGIGGHCIPVDPLYFSWKLKTLKYQARFIELADQVNAGMPAVVVEKAAQALNDMSLPVRGSRVLLAGVAYKRDVGDTRESPAQEIVTQLRNRGADVAYFDDFVAAFAVDGIEVRKTSIDEASATDLVIIVTNHSHVDYPALIMAAPAVVDTRGVVASGGNLYRL